MASSPSWAWLLTSLSWEAEDFVVAMDSHDVLAIAANVDPRSSQTPIVEVAEVQAACMMPSMVESMNRTKSRLCGSLVHTGTPKAGSCIPCQQQPLLSESDPTDCDLWSGDVVVLDVVEPIAPLEGSGTPSNVGATPTEHEPVDAFLVSSWRA